MRDPVNGPPKIGWPVYDPKADDGGTMLRFGADRKAAQKVSGTSVEGVCSGQGTYDPFP